VRACVCVSAHITLQGGECKWKY